MVKKMKFVNIMGPVNDIERVKSSYIKKYDIQIEDAVKELSSVNKEISFYSNTNPLVDALKEIEIIAEKAKVTENSPTEEIDSNEALKVIEQINSQSAEYDAKIESLIREKKNLEKLTTQITPFTDLDIDMEKLFHFSFIKYRFGKIPTTSYRQFKAYLHGDSSLIFLKTHVEEDYVWGFYFVPRTIYERVDAIFSSLYFERVEISKDLEGKPMEAYSKFKIRMEEIDTEIEQIEKDKQKNIEDQQVLIASALKNIREQYNFGEMQKYIAKTPEDFYIIVGWMTEQDAKAFEEEVKDDDDVVVIIKNESPNIKSSPPTKLSNLAIFRPFEFFVGMYGLPSYNEIDPTPFVGITYTILFGIMFGDLGQGLVLSLLGFLLYKKKGSQLGAILTVIGISSAFFGLMFGTVFGYEHILPALWMRPMENTEQILIVTVAFGVCLNLCAIIIKILNSIKNKDYGNLFFSSNGLSGLCFYIAVILLALSSVLGLFKIPMWIIELLIAVPLILIILQQPLTNLIMGNEKLLNQSIGEFLMEALFGAFEIILSYVTNTISFVRVGAFALCHAGMMSVVLLLAGAGHDSTGNIIVMILGNIFVMCLEGLIVGIQVLRLEYYEMFSRFFKGDGKAFKSFRNHKS